jgi:hypothetical protein
MVIKIIKLKEKIKKTLVEIIIAITLALPMKQAKADFYDGLRIPKNYNYQLDHRLDVSENATTYKIIPKYFGEYIWGFLSLSSTNGEFNDPYVGVGAIIKKPVPMLPTLEAKVSKNGKEVDPYLSLYATQLFKNSKFEISPRLSYDAESNTLSYGSTFGMQINDLLRLGVDVYGDLDNKPRVRGLYRLDFDENKFFRGYIDRNGMGFRVGINF